ncbi:MAG: trypsin-like peptidase domain-containing protein [Planctomycetota bacterium]
MRRVRPSFVLLHAEHRRTKFGVDIAEATVTPFSGILFDPNGYILTVGQVIEGAEMISAEDHRGEFELCQAIGYDPASGVGVLKISPREDGQPIQESESAAEVGQPIFSLGNPYYLGATLSVGHVTGTGRTIESRGRVWTNLLQLSLAVNPGDQGGPILDYQGRLIGMVLTRYRPPAIASLEDVDVRGISFGLPAQDALITARNLIEVHGQVTSTESTGGGKPWLGVRIQSIEDPILISQLKLGPDRGVLIESVFNDSPARKAGLEKNDVIVEFDRSEVQGLRHFGELVRRSKPGSKVPVLVIRAGDRQLVEMVIGERRTIEEK